VEELEVFESERTRTGLLRLRRSLRGGVQLTHLASYEVGRLAKKWDACASSVASSVRQIYPICFGCGKHYDLLRLALYSLSLFGRQIKVAYIYMDRTDALSSEQQKALRSVSKIQLEFRLTRFPMAQGIPVFLSELEAYRDVLSQMRREDLLMKFDSDIIFISDKVFDFVLSSSANAIGTGIHQIQQRSLGKTIHRRTDDMQGGCYFVKGAALHDILRHSSCFSAWEMRSAPEDQFISRLLRDRGTRPLLEEYMYFDPEFAKAELTTEKMEQRIQMIPRDFSVIHFEGDKRNMRRVCENILPNSPV
jgi:hypothetical protein